MTLDKNFTLWSDKNNFEQWVNCSSSQATVKREKKIKIKIALTVRECNWEKKGEWITKFIQMDEVKWKKKCMNVQYKADSTESAIVYTLIVCACEHTLMSCHAEMHTPTYIFKWTVVLLFFSSVFSRLSLNIVVALIIYSFSWCFCTLFLL